MTNRLSPGLIAGMTVWFFRCFGKSGSSSTTPEYKSNKKMRNCSVMSRAHRRLSG